MSNERDTQFAGFAKAVVNELEEAMRDHGRLPIGKMVFPDFFTVAESIITQRAYDLVTHVIEHAPEYPNVDDWNIPDLEELPKE